MQPGDRDFVPRLHNCGQLEDRGWKKGNRAQELLHHRAQAARIRWLARRDLLKLRAINLKAAPSLSFPIAPTSRDGGSILKGPQVSLCRSVVRKSHNRTFHSSENGQIMVTHKKDGPPKHSAAGGQTRKECVLSKGRDRELQHRQSNIICGVGRRGGHPGWLAGHPVSSACRDRSSAPAGGLESTSGPGGQPEGCGLPLELQTPPWMMTRSTCNPTPRGRSHTRRGKDALAAITRLVKSSQSLGSWGARLGFVFNGSNLTGFIDRAFK